MASVVQPNPGRFAWVFDTNQGALDANPKNTDLYALAIYALAIYALAIYALAIYAGDVAAVPEPGGLGGLVAVWSCRRDGDASAAAGRA